MIAGIGTDLVAIGRMGRMWERHGTRICTRILADATISIDAMLQKEPGEGETKTDIILLTHQTQEKNVDSAIARIEALPTVEGKVTRIRLEQLA